MKDRQLGRREFTLEAALALWRGVATTVSGCGSTAPAGPTAPPPQGDVTGVVSLNHGHSGVVTRAQLTAGGELELNIQGMADHPHVVALGPGHLGSIADGLRVVVNSSAEELHSHTVTFN